MARHSSAQAAKLKQTAPNNLISRVHLRLAEADKLRKAGKFARAIEICEGIIEKFPDYVAALHTLGLIHMERENYWAALSLFMRAAMLNPKDWTILTNLSVIYVRLGALELAARTLEDARRYKDDDVSIHLTLGEIYSEEREYELAAESFAEALRLDPTHFGAAFGLGRCCDHLGRVGEAAAAFKRALAIEPGSPPTLNALSQLPASLVDIDMLAAIELAEKITPKNDEDAASYLGLAKAFALDKAGRHKDAWEAMANANLALKLLHVGDWEIEKHNSRVSREKASRLPVMRAQKNRNPDIPMSLFIIGPSRSGKTTMEKLVGTLDRVKRGYESNVIDKAARRTFQLSGLPTLARLTVLPPALHQRFSEIYADELKDHISGARIFTSTHPGKIHDIGQIALAVPNSRFIFVRRDRYDIAIRMFGKKYRRTGNHYAYDMDNVFYYIDWYYDMIDIWAKMLPNRSMVVDYDQMIADPAATLERGAAFCGLSISEVPLPPLGDDRGCSKPYRAWMDAARGSAG